MKRRIAHRLLLQSVVTLVWALYSVSVYGQDVDWQQFFSTPVNDRFYYDDASVKHRSDDSVVAVRIKGVSGDEIQKVREMLNLLEIDCRHETYRRVEGQLRFRDGSVSQDVGPSLWSDINYGSYLDELSKIVCKKPKGRRTLR